MERRSFFNDRVHTGIIGAGGRGRYLIGQFKELGVSGKAGGVSSRVRSQYGRPTSAASIATLGAATDIAE
jgi:hypothetical protein